MHYYGIHVWKIIKISKLISVLHSLCHNFAAAAPEEVTGYYFVYGNCGSNDIQNISPGSVQGCAPVCENNTACVGKHSTKYLGDVK